MKVAWGLCVLYRYRGKPAFKMTFWSFLMVVILAVLLDNSSASDQEIEDGSWELRSRDRVPSDCKASACMDYCKQLGARGGYCSTTSIYCVCINR
ncbi:uncharacterized protein [Dermacentor andersoni]|uniref:uncharacterized protein isoform X2 n=1 Tax=Dermacentor andersoni TaxID=34620 RepID=UPI002416A6BF|nr:uncharacterized protein LOC126543990 isoform X3 [Dermacentor andersoni]